MSLSWSNNLHIPGWQIECKWPQVRQGPRSSIRMVIGIFCSDTDTVFVQLNQYSQILRRQCCLPQVPVLKYQWQLNRLFFCLFGLSWCQQTLKGRFVCNEYIANKKYLPCKKANRGVQASPLQLALGADKTPRPRCRNVAKLVCSRECGWVALLSSPSHSRYWRIKWYGGRGRFDTPGKYFAAHRPQGQHPLQGVLPLRPVGERRRGHLWWRSPVSGG